MTGDVGGSSGNSSARVLGADADAAAVAVDIRWGLRATFDRSPVGSEPLGALNWESARIEDRECRAARVLAFARGTGAARTRLNIDEVNILSSACDDGRARKWGGVGESRDSVFLVFPKFSLKICSIYTFLGLISSLRTDFWPFGGILEISMEADTALFDP